MKIHKKIIAISVICSLFSSSFLIVFSAETAKAAFKSKAEALAAACGPYDPNKKTPAQQTESQREGAQSGTTESIASKEKYDACKKGFNASQILFATEPINTAPFGPCYTDSNLFLNSNDGALKQACHSGYVEGYKVKDSIRELPEEEEKTPEQREQENKDNEAWAACDKEMKVETSNKDDILRACQEGYLAGKKDDSDTSKADACNSKSGIYKQACNTGFTLAVDTSSTEPGSLSDCDTELSSPLSWMMCPLIDLGTSLTDFVFKDIVKPLLSDIPVSPETDDPAYRAWQGFRFLANIMLIGTMLAIVYAQVRGDK